MSNRTVEGIRYTLDHGYYDTQGAADIRFLLERLDAAERPQKTPTYQLQLQGAIERMRGAAFSEERIIDEVGKAMAETLPERS